MSRVSGDMIISTSPDMIARARHYEAQVLNSHVVRTTENYTGPNINGRYYYGYLSEFAFEVALQTSMVKFKSGGRPIGRPDSHDFVIWTYGKPMTINVKNAHHARCRKMIVNRAMHDKQQSDLYVGTRIHEGFVVICGFATRDEVENMDVDDFHKYGHNCPGYWIWLNELTPIDNLFDVCDRDNLAEMML